MQRGGETERTAIVRIVVLPFLLRVAHSVTGTWKHDSVRRVFQASRRAVRRRCTNPRDEAEDASGGRLSAAGRNEVAGWRQAEPIFAAVAVSGEGVTYEDVQSSTESSALVRAARKGAGAHLHRYQNGPTTRYC